jgi:putative transcriptional regulator
MRINREKLAVAMIRADLNVSKLVEKSGLSRSTITAVRSGKTCSKQTADKLVAVLGKSILKGE